MDGTPPTAETTEGGDFDPRRAAAVLDKATQQARRSFTPLTPLLLTFRAVVLLVVFGGLWLSVRGQHPYSGLHGGWAVVLAIVLVTVNIGLSAFVVGRAAIGVSGPAQRKWGAWTGIMAGAWIIGYAVTVPLYHATVSQPVWGLYPETAPLLIIGLVGAAIGAVFRYWSLAVILLAIAVVATAAGFGGPASSWLITAIGLCAVYLGAAAVTFWAQRRSVVSL